MVCNAVLYRKYFVVLKSNSDSEQSEGKVDKIAYRILHHRVDVREEVGVDGALRLIASETLVTEGKPQTVTAVASSSHLD